MEDQPKLTNLILVSIFILLIFPVSSIYSGLKEREELASILSNERDLLRQTREEVLLLKLATERLIEETNESTKLEIERMISREREKIARIEEDLLLEREMRLQSESQIRELAGLSDSKIKELEASLNNSYDLVSIISQWRGITASVQCDFLFGGTSGSGILLKFREESGEIIGVLTNKHVLTDSFGRIASSCRVEFPLRANVYTGTSQNKDIEIATADLDFGRIIIKEPDSYIKNLTREEIDVCKSRAQIGDEIIILGHPAIGSRGDITATEGIISGFDGDYYITSAKVERGNSGGTAVLLKDNCLLGVPTFVSFGALESLARILDINILYR